MDCNTLKVGPCFALVVDNIERDTVELADGMKEKPVIYSIVSTMIPVLFSQG